ncbi:PDZ domain-containing protein 11 [Crotalus adamanteus]|uniref:PDZ domain-containing protein 11 n=1 Tax=Crotalus adamanteus TaxID=8729 RepID=A0AAW1BJA9_CROAD
MPITAGRPEEGEAALWRASVPSLESRPERADCFRGRRATGVACGTPGDLRLSQRIYHSDYNNELTQFLPRTIILKKPSGAQLGFNIRGGKASQLGIFISKVIPDSDAHRAGLQEGDQVLAVNDVDFQDIEHSKAVEILKTAREIIMRVRFFPYNYHRQKERTVH